MPDPTGGMDFDENGLVRHGVDGDDDGHDFARMGNARCWSAPR
jgi:hypothetical protein